MPLRKPHEQKYDRSLGRMVTVRENPTVSSKINGQMYHWQNGQFFTARDGPPVDPELVPEEFRAMIEAKQRNAAAMRTCKYCGERMPACDYEAHLELEVARMAERTVRESAKEPVAATPSQPNGKRRVPKRRSAPSRKRTPAVTPPATPPDFGDAADGNRPAHD